MREKILEAIHDATADVIEALLHRKKEDEIEARRRLEAALSLLEEITPQSRIVIPATPTTSTR